MVRVGGGIEVCRMAIRTFGGRARISLVVTLTACFNIMALFQREKAMIKRGCPGEGVDVVALGTVIGKTCFFMIQFGGIEILSGMAIHASRANSIKA